jgi:hypothetical protein
MIVLNMIKPVDTDKRINVSSPYLEIYHTKEAKHKFGSRTT